MAVKLWDFEVSHPDYPTVRVSSIGPDSASLQAATERWGLTRKEWAGIAAYIDVRKWGPTFKPRCRRCGAETAKPGLCLDCARAEEQYRREVSSIRAPDRRAGYRERYRA